MRQTEPVTGDSRQKSRWPLVLGALRYRDFRLFWLGSITEHTGEFMGLAAILWLVNDITHSPLMLTIVGSSQFVTRVFFSTIGGVAADRMNRRRLLIAALLAAALLSLVLAVLAATGYIAIWQLIVISLLSGVVMSFNHPARQAIVPNLVSKDYLLNAVSVDILSIQVSRAIGMPIAGYVILTAGVWPIFALRALGCLLAVFWILMVNVPPTSATARTQAPWRNLAQGFHYLRGNIVVLAVVLSFFIPILVQSAYTSFLPVFAGDILRIDAVGYGYLQGAPGVGAILFLIGLSLLTYYNGKLRLLIISIALLGVGLLGFSLSNWFFLSLLMLVVIGAMAAAFLAINTTLLQGMVPDEMRGRIMSWREISFGLGPAGSIMFGALALHTGVQFSLGSLGSICLILSLALIILLPRLRSAG